MIYRLRSLPYRLTHPTYSCHPAPFDIACGRWWSRRRRKASKLAARVIAYEWDRGGRERYEAQFAESVAIGLHGLPTFWKPAWGPAQEFGPSNPANSTEGLS